MTNQPTFYLERVYIRREGEPERADTGDERVAAYTIAQALYHAERWNGTSVLWVFKPLAAYQRYIEGGRRASVLVEDEDYALPGKRLHE